MKSKRIYLSFVCISLVLLVLALFILSKANYEHTKEKIITEDSVATSERINLIIAIQIVIQNALDLLGIIPREEM